jgi:cytoskeletal protein CcmA (bactofilin family)
MAEATTIIAAGTTVRGHLQGTEDLLVQGAVQGTVRLDGAITVDAAARVDADAEVVAATVAGIFVGRLAAAEVIELGATARVRGDLFAPRIIIRGGALFDGTLDTLELPGAVSARPATTPVAPVAPPAVARPAVVVPASNPRPAFPPVSRPAVSPPAVVAAPAPVVAVPVAAVPAPAPVPAAAAPSAEPQPAANDSHEVEAFEADDEPELPDAAARKQVVVKKRK